jgi:tryptophan aminotransferase
MPDSCPKKQSVGSLAQVRTIVDLLLTSDLDLTTSVRSLFPLEATPGLISLLAGKPNPSTFPFTSFSFTARSPSDSNSESVLTVEGNDLIQGLQYGETAGLPKLLHWIHGLQEFSHGRKINEGWAVSMGCGSQDSIFKVNH